MSPFPIRNTPVKPLVAAALLLMSGGALVSRSAWGDADAFGRSSFARYTDGGYVYELHGGMFDYEDWYLNSLSLLPGLAGGNAVASGEGIVRAWGGDGAWGSSGGAGGNATAAATGDAAHAMAFGGLGGLGRIGVDGLGGKAIATATGKDAHAEAVSSYNSVATADGESGDIKAEARGDNAVATAHSEKGDASAYAVGVNAEATASGEGKSVSAEGYGKNIVVRASGVNRFEDIAVVATYKAANGGDFNVGHNDIDGMDAVISNLPSGGSGGTLHLVQNAGAGSGGGPTLDEMGNAISLPGHAGNASSSLSGQNSLGGDIFLESNAVGGGGGGSDDLGLDGGSAIASAYAVDSGEIFVYATAAGGYGGSSESFLVGWGGTAKLGRVYGASTGGGTVLVSGQATGGHGGSGLWSDVNRSGGWGRSVHLENAVDGDTTGALTLRQVAFGGAAGRDASSGKAPKTYGAGSASSSLSKTTASDALDVESRAYVPGGGGDATAKAIAINIEGSASATSWAGGCTSFVSMYDCTSGSTEASATARGMDAAKARASAQGSESGYVFADAGSYAGTGKTLTARAYAGAELPKNTTNTSPPGLEVSAMGATAAAGVHIAPSKVSDIDGTDDKQAAAYVVTEPGALVALMPDVDGFFATGGVGAIGRFKAYNDGHRMSSAHIDLSFDLTDLNLTYDPSIPANNQHLMLMFLNPTSYGSGAVDGLNFSIDVAGQNVFSKTASNTDDAAAYLSGGVLDLADLAGGGIIWPTGKPGQIIDQKLDVSMQLSLVAGSDWGGLSFDFVLGTRVPGDDSTPLPSTNDSITEIFLNKTPPKNFPGDGYPLYGLAVPPSPESVPLPPALWMMASGVAALFGWRRKS